MWSKAMWLRIPRSELEKKKIVHGDLGGRFAYFRCAVDLPGEAEDTQTVKDNPSDGRTSAGSDPTRAAHRNGPDCTLTADVSANSRYRLWVNGSPVLSGPCKGDTFRQYFETVDLSAYLQPGRNVFCAQVLYCDPDIAEIQTDERASIYGVIGQRCGHRFALEGAICTADGEIAADLTTGAADWRVYLEDSYYLVSDETTQFLGAVLETVDAARVPLRWKEPGFDVSGWKAAESAGMVQNDGPLAKVGVVPRFRMTQRPIPLLYEQPDGFVSLWDRHTGEILRKLEQTSNTELPAADGSAARRADADKLGCGDADRDDAGTATLPDAVLLTIPPHTSRDLILDAGVHKNGYLRFAFSGGAGAAVSITCFEKFGGAGSDLKRDDFKNGSVSGITDRLRLDGGNVVFEPFWVRTFRFIQLHIETAGEGITVRTPSFRKTGYPLAVRSGVSSSAPWVQKVWDICVRTLENCMLETYMDCPYYEQLQFAMDTRLEALYTYATSGDPRLAKKALTDFHYGMQPEGLTPGKYPSVYLQILSTFSLHYIYMLWEYYEQTGDAQTVRLFRGDADRILEFYDAHIGADGLVGGLPYWQFVDWLDIWGESAGEPAALSEGPSTIINLMYAYALGCAGRLYAATGRACLADEYAARRAGILERVRALCWDAEAGLYREGPAFSQYTQHAQAWAVVNGMETPENARRILQTAIERADCVKATFPAAYEWFRALEYAGMYQQMRQFLEDWIALPDLGCTTCPETPKGARSECHAWSALPMYEMMRTVAGVRPAGIGWEAVEIGPHPMDLPDLSAEVTTPKGAVRVGWQTDPDGTITYTADLPQGLPGTRVADSGEHITLKAGRNVWKINSAQTRADRAATPLVTDR